MGFSAWCVGERILVVHRRKEGANRTRKAIAAEAAGCILCQGTACSGMAPQGAALNLAAVVSAGASAAGPVHTLGAAGCTASGHLVDHLNHTAFAAGHIVAAVAEDIVGDAVVIAQAAAGIGVVAPVVAGIAAVAAAADIASELVGRVGGGS